MGLIIRGALEVWEDLTFLLGILSSVVSSFGRARFFPLDEAGSLISAVSGEALVFEE
jgi:hypothetical protein